MKRKQKVNTLGLFLVCASLLISAGSVLAKMPDSLETNPEIGVIAVLSESDFVPDRTDLATPFGFPDALTDRVLERLSKSKRFIPVERESMRRVIVEQRFGQDLAESYLDRTMNKAISSLDTMESTGDRVVGTSMRIEAGMGIPGGIQIENSLTPQPLGEGIREGEGKIGTTGSLGNFNDILKDYLDLGTAAGTDFIVFGNLEKNERDSSNRSVDYNGVRVETNNRAELKARIRIIDTKNSMVIGAASIQTELDETLLSGEKSRLDDATIFDALSAEIAGEVIDIVYPARIASIDPITITRGSNDLVATGDEYTVLREGESIKDQDDIVLGRLTTKVGLVSVSTPEENFSIVDVLENDSIKVGDLVRSVEDDTQLEDVVTAEKQVEARDKPSIAVGNIHFLEKPKGCENSPQVFTDTLISGLTQTRRFDVIDRQEVRQLLNEKEATLMREGEKLPSAIGNLIGADYLVLGMVPVFSLVDEDMKLPNSSLLLKRRTGRVEGNIRITEVDTGVVLESRKISISQILENMEDISALEAQLAGKFAFEAIETVLNAIYKVKVMAVSGDGTIYINRGIDGGLVEGHILSVFRQGQAIVDPDSNRNMGNEESLLGEVLITEVEDTRSKASLLSGGPFTRGDVLKSTKHAAAPTNTAGGAVKQMLAVRLMKMDKGLASSGISPAKLQYLSNVLMAEVNDTADYTIVERLEIDEVLNEKTMEAIINGTVPANTLSSLSVTGQILVGGITTMKFAEVSETIPYIDKVEVWHSGRIEGVFKIVDTDTGQMASIESVSVEQKFKPDMDRDQAQNALLRAYGKQIVMALLDMSAPIEDVQAKSKVMEPAW